MRKIVNGKVVDVINMELFELAAEGLIKQKKAVSNISDGIDKAVNSTRIQTYLKLYDSFIKSMPYPLYAIEEDIKYAALGTFIKGKIKNEDKLWVRNGLHIKLNDETGMSIHMVNNTWSIEYNTVEQSDNTSLDVYKENIAYDEYKWIVDKALKGESTGAYYNVFMKDFVKACNGSSITLKWELENILTFSNIPEKQEMPENKIVDYDNKVEYLMDIFLKEKVKSKTDSQVTMSLVGNGGVRTVYKETSIYDFDTFSKKFDADSKDKIEKAKLVGMQNVFNTASIIKRGLNLKEYPSFFGFIIEDNIVFSINKRLYMCDKNRVMKPIDIAYNVDVFAIDNSSVYFTKKIKTIERVNKINVYKYNTFDKTTRICGIQFE